MPDLWSLAILGITDPREKKETEDAAIQYFKDTVTVNNDGRCKVSLLGPNVKNNLKLTKIFQKNTYWLKLMKTDTCRL